MPTIVLKHASARKLRFTGIEVLSSLEFHARWPEYSMHIDIFGGTTAAKEQMADKEVDLEEHDKLDGKESELSEDEQTTDSFVVDDATRKGAELCLGFIKLESAQTVETANVLPPDNKKVAMQKTHSSFYEDFKNSKKRKIGSSLMTDRVKKVGKL